MKKIFSIIMSILILISFAGCTQKESVKETKEKITIKVATLKGPTGLSMMKMIKDNPKIGDNVEVEYTIATTPDLLKSKVLNNEVDIVALPTNMAAILYNKGQSQYKLGAINTLGVLYLVSTRDDIKSINDLNGKDIKISSKGSVPDFIFRYVLDKNHIRPNNISYVMEHSNLAKEVIEGDTEIALLPEPFVTMVNMKNKDAKVVLDIQKEYGKVQESDSSLPMGCILVKNQLAKNNPQIVDEFFKSYEKSINWVNGNVKEAGDLAQELKILPNNKMAELSIPKCNIVYVNSKASKVILDKFYEILLNFNPKSVGGKIPDEEFYY